MSDLGLRLPPDCDHVAKFAAIGRGTSEIRLPKEKKHHGQNISPSGTAVPGGLITHAHA